MLDGGALWMTAPIRARSVLNDDKSPCLDNDFKANVGVT